MNFSFGSFDSGQNHFPADWNFVTGGGSGEPGTVGLSGTTAGATYGPANSAAQALIDSNGNATNFDITMGATAFQKSSDFGPTGFTPSQTLGIPENTAENLMIGPSGTSFTLSNLDASKTYSFSFYGSINDYVNADASTYNGWAVNNDTYSVAGLTSGSGTIDVSHNQNLTANINNIAPDANGDITITLTGAIPLVNVMTLTENPVEAPEPSSFALFALGAGMLLFVVRRRRSVA